MKHYYFYRDTKNICSFSVEGVRSGFFYLGQFKSEVKAYENLRSIIMHLIDCNNMLMDELGLNNEFVDSIESVPHKDLGVIFKNQYTTNSELMWAVRVRE